MKIKPIKIPVTRISFGGAWNVFSCNKRPVRRVRPVRKARPVRRTRRR